MTRRKSRFIRMTRLVSLETTIRVILQNLLASFWQTQSVCTQRNELFTSEMHNYYWRKFYVVTVAPGGVISSVRRGTNAVTAPNIQGRGIQRVELQKLNAAIRW